jgi:hypothetical protein
MTPRSLGISLGAAALVAAAFFARGTAKKGELHLVSAQAARPDGAPIAEEHDELPAEGEPQVEALETSGERNEIERKGEQAERKPDSELVLAEDSEEEQKPPTARELHMPVIRAIRGDHRTPEARKEAMLQALRDSGHTSEAWTSRGREVFESWQHLIPKEIAQTGLRETARCYQAGCEMAVRFANHEDAEKAQAAFRELQDPSPELHGGRVQTPAVDVGGGAYEASWIMLRPEGT